MQAFNHNQVFPASCAYSIELVRLCHKIMLNHVHSNSEFNAHTISEFNAHSNSEPNFFLLKAVLFNVNIGENL